MKSILLEEHLHFREPEKSAHINRADINTIIRLMKDKGLKIDEDESFIRSRVRNRGDGWQEEYHLLSDPSIRDIIGFSIEDIGPYCNIITGIRYERKEPIGIDCTIRYSAIIKKQAKAIERRIYEMYAGR